MKEKYIVDSKITNEFVEAFIKTTYRIIGKNKHSAIKPCHWFEQRLLTGRDNRNCYKGIFGIQSHRCLQNTPSLPFCNHQCVFCWRDIENGSLGSEFAVEPDDPKEIIEEMIRHQQDIITNHLALKRYLDNYEIMKDILYYMLTNEEPQNIYSLSKNIRISKNKIERALTLLKNQKFISVIDSKLNSIKIEPDIKKCINSRDEIEQLINRELTTPDEIIQTHNQALYPNHAAISLDGEPLLYPRISEFVEEFRNRKMTTFIVTNSTLPERINSLTAFPSQLYLTLPASNEQIYKKICRPMVKDGWKRIMETMESIESLSCRTLVRLTAVKDLNIKEDDKLIKDYLKIIENANPNFFEIKGFTLQASALLINERLKSNEPINYYFPEYLYLKNIAKQFEELGNFPLIFENEVSRDFLFAVNWQKDKDPKITIP